MSFQEYSESIRSRLKFGDVNKKALEGIVCIAVLALIAAAMMFVPPMLGSFDGSAEAAEPDGIVIEGSDAGAEANSFVCVHVGGCVASPGVVQLPSGSRVADAVVAAGGMSQEADSNAINLARVLDDGEQVIIPSLNQLTTADGSVPQQESDKGIASDGKVNINKATLDELKTLSGIGDSKAQKIIDYRESAGPFMTIEDLCNVSGIGEKTLDNLRSSICV